MKKASLLIILILSFIFFSCQDETEKKYLKRQKIIQNSIEELKKSNLLLGSTDFIINPYCGDFEFNSYTNKFYPQFKKDHLESKKEVYSTLNLNDSTFSLLKDKIKPDYTYKNISQDLSNNESKLLITFSGISDKILFVEMIKLCNSISFNEINVNKSYLKRKREAVSSLVILLNNNKVVDILVENMIASERQCTDISDNE